MKQPFLPVLGAMLLAACGASDPVAPGDGTPDPPTPPGKGYVVEYDFRRFPLTQSDMQCAGMPDGAVGPHGQYWRRDTRTCARTSDAAAQRRGEAR